MFINSFFLRCKGSEMQSDKGFFNGTYIVCVFMPADFTDETGFHGFLILLIGEICGKRNIVVVSNVRRTAARLYRKPLPLCVSEPLSL